MMSITGNESIALEDCLRQLKKCAEFLTASSRDIERDLKEIEIINNDKKESRKDFDKIKRSLKKIHKEAKQKLHNIGKSLKDPDDINLDIVSRDEENGEQIQITADIPTISNPSQENGNKENSDHETVDKDPNENLNHSLLITDNKSDRSKSPDRTVEETENVKSDTAIQIANNVKHEDVKQTIRLVAIEKLLDPKVIRKKSCEKFPNTVFNPNNSVIILDSDEDDVQPITVQPVNVEPEKRRSLRVRPLPKIKQTKVLVKRCKIIKGLLQAKKQYISVHKMSSHPRRMSTDSADTRSDSVKLSSMTRRTHVKTENDNESISSRSSHRKEPEKRIHSENEKHHSRESKSFRSESRSSRSDRHDRHDRKTSSRSSEKRKKGNSSDEDVRKRNKSRQESMRDKPGPSSSKANTECGSDVEVNSREHLPASSKEKSRNSAFEDENESDKSGSRKSNISSLSKQKNKDDKKQSNKINENSGDEIESNSSKRSDAVSRLTRKNRNAANDDEEKSNSRKESHKSNTAETSSRKKSNDRIKNSSVKSSGDDDDNGSEKETSSDEEKVSKRQKKKTAKSSDEDYENNDGKNSDKSSEDEEIFNNKKKHSKRKRIRTSSCSSTFEDHAEEDDDDNESDSDDDKKKKKKTKRRVKCGSDSDNDTPTKRKNIRKVIKTINLDCDTLKATEAEKERRKRLEERQKVYNQIFEKPESVEIDKMVLDFDEETKEELLAVDKGLLKKLKPHQVTGVKFMWDSCYETLKDIKEKPGSGCILGHCMGLGKTLQIVTLAHTLLANSKRTGVHTVLVITPLSTVTNWAREFEIWMKFCKYKNIDVYDMSKFKDKKHRLYKLKEWHEDGGVCILGYDMYRILANPKMAGGKKMREKLQETLVDPGPDLIVCDEGHLLKNEKTSISQAVSRVRTQRRIVLSGTPLQNNLKEYYCMIQFVKPNLLGTYKEYLNRFVNPITNGQYTDSNERDIRLMKNRSHVLHKMLEGCIQRRDYSVLAPYLPPKHEYVVFIALSDLQKKLYEYYMKTQRTSDSSGKGTALFQDFQNLRRIWTHPMTLKVNSVIAKKKRERKMLMEDDTNSLEDFIDDDSDTSESEANSSSSDSDDSKNSAKVKKNKTKASSSRRTRQNANDSEVEEVGEIVPDPEEEVVEMEWWMTFCPESELNNIHHSPKLMLLFELLQESESIGDKILLFSQSLQSLDVIEKFLSLIDRKTRGEEDECDVNGFIGSWSLGTDYFRLDGSHSVESREYMCKRFNDTSDYRSRLFLISTRAGSLGINLVAANRVIIFDASWNPSHDTQSIFRVYRFGQNKPCYIYRFIAKGTMEEKVYERQVTKQATAKRVIDEQQIGRHYNQNDLLELYQYELNTPDVREIPIFPKDRLFADLLKKHDKLIINYHEHDSLLENKESENLSEEERKAAWSEYEAEKERPAQSQQQYMAYARPNYRNGPVTSSKIFGFRTDVLLRLLNLKVKRDNPQMADMEVGNLVPRYLRELYDQMNVGNTSLHTELVELSVALEMPQGYFVNPMSSNYIFNPFYQPPQHMQNDPSYIHEID